MYNLYNFIFFFVNNGEVLFGILKEFALGHARKGLIVKVDGKFLFQSSLRSFPLHLMELIEKFVI